MPTRKLCPVCGANSYQKIIIPGVLFGFYCSKCDEYFEVCELVQVQKEDKEK